MDKRTHIGELCGFTKSYHFGRWSLFLLPLNIFILETTRDRSNRQARNFIRNIVKKKCVVRLHREY
jgi:hypothetical protein